MDNQLSEFPKLPQKGLELRLQENQLPWLPYFVVKHATKLYCDNNPFDDSMQDGVEPRGEDSLQERTRRQVWGDAKAPSSSTAALDQPKMFCDYCNGPIWEQYYDATVIFERKKMFSDHGELDKIPTRGIFCSPHPEAFEEAKYKKKAKK